MIVFFFIYKNVNFRYNKKRGGFMEYKVYDYNSYRIHTIKTDKFKNCTLEIMFRNKLEKDKITENNMQARFP